MSPWIPTQEETRQRKKRAAHILKVLQEEARKTLDSGNYLSPDRKEFLKHILSKKTFSGDLSPWAGLLSKELLQRLRKLNLIEGELISEFDPANFTNSEIRQMLAEISWMKPHAERGLKVLNAAKEGGKTSRPEIEKKYAEWQAIADEVWTKYPEKTKYDVARIIKSRTRESYPSANPNTIRRAITKPSRNKLS
jgi:hypothetical protein